MRLYLLATPLLAAAASASAAPPAIQVPPELTDPQFVERMADMTQALSKALLELRVGEIQAATEGRAPTAADRQRTVGDVAQISPRELHRQIAQARPRIEAATQAFAKALPEITKALSEATTAIDRAAANMPRPDYPKR
ncbi:MAG TPA: hypothetical protein VFI88_06700 [Sphingomicrobium sp.]|jgi:hypothetical protein|nr:hypothetical protein [Sphingomicrobium sp.]